MGAAGHPVQVSAGLGRVGRLSERPAVEDDIGVAGDHQLSSPAPAPRAPSAARSRDLVLGVPAAQLLDPGNHDLELDPQLGRGSPAAAASPMRGRTSGQLWEPDPDLALGRLVGVGAVDHVESHLEGEVPADQAGGGLDRVGGTDQLAGGRDRFGSLEDDRDQRSAGDEVDELAEERLLGVLGVVLVGDRLVGRAASSGRRYEAPCARSGRSPRRSGHARRRQALRYEGA